MVRITTNFGDTNVTSKGMSALIFAELMCSIEAAIQTIIKDFDYTVEEIYEELDRVRNADTKAEEHEKDEVDKLIEKLISKLKEMGAEEDEV